ncbi:MAG TPA: N-acetylmuramoyl-L-alanine amidase [Usitatibacter sp.]|nr:N-acetylmuramoyl-L-alanine amidase [Usitatibacter sp.]
MARALAFLILALAAGCGEAPLRTALPSTWVASPNFDERRPNLVVIHHTSDDTVEKALATLTDPLRQVSAHYLVGRDGRIWQLVDERKRAWHAGVSHWGADTDVNSDSIGIELDNDGDEPFPDAQVQSLLALLADLKARYGIPTANFVGHADVAPGRKVDPSRWFPWHTLAEHGFGLWCESPAPQAPAGFDPVLALQALGYDVSDADAAIRAFDLHYGEGEGTGMLTDHAKAVLACLVEEARVTP